MIDNQPDLTKVREVMLEAEMDSLYAEIKAAIKAGKMTGIMFLAQSDKDGQFVFKYSSAGLKTTEKISLLEAVKHHILTTS